MPGMMIMKGKNILGRVPISGVRRAADMESAAMARWTTRKFVHQYPNESTKTRTATMLKISTPLGVFGGTAQIAPGVEHFRVVGKVRLHAFPTAGLTDRQDGQRREPQYDEEKLEDLIIYGAGEAAEERIRQHDGRRSQHGHVETPSQHQMQQQPQGIHGDARGEDGHDRERKGVEGAGLFVETHLQVFRHRTGFAAVVEGHHENAHEEHGGDGAQPIEMSGHDADRKSTRLNSSHAN